MSQRSLWAVGLSLLFSLTVVDAAPADGDVNPLNTLGTSLTDFTYVILISFTLVWFGLFSLY